MVTLRVRVPATATIGEKLRYRLVVTNPTQSPAHHVIVRCQLPSNATFVAAEPKPSETTPEYRWKLRTLAAGARQEILLDAQPNGEGSIKLCARVQFEHGQCVETRLAKSSLVVRIQGPRETVVTKPVSHKIQVTNTGRTQAENVVLSVTLPPELEFTSSAPKASRENPLEWNLGTIEAGRTRVVDVRAVSRKSGTVTLRASTRDRTGQVARAEATTVIGAPKLTISSEGPDRLKTRTDAKYSIVVRNQGTTPLTNVRVSNVVPTGIDFVSASVGGQRVGNEVRWNLGNLAAGDQRNLELTLQAREAGELINRTTVEADGGLSDQSETRTTFEGASGLSVEVKRGTALLQVGKTTTFTIRIVNRGNGDATELRLSATASDGLKLLSAMGQTIGETKGQKALFNELTALAAGTEAKYTIEVEGLKEGPARLDVELQAKELTSGAVLAAENISVTP